MPHARTWLRAIGTIKSTIQVRSNMAVFMVKASQYVSGSGPSAKLAEFDIMVRHNVSKKNFYDRTKKAKLGSKVSIVGELDIHENKLYIEMHNFEYISGTTPYTSTSPSASEKRALLYNSLTETPDKLPKKPKVSAPTDNNNSSEPNTNTSTGPILITEENSVEQLTQPKPRQPRKRTLRSTKKFSDIATNKLDFSNIHDESE